MRRSAAMAMLAGAVALGAGAQEPSAHLSVAIGKALVVESAANIERVSIGSSETAEALAVSPHEILLNGKAAGETSLILWQQGGSRVVYDVTILPSGKKIDAARRQLRDELSGSDVRLDFENDAVFLRGTVPDLISAERASAIAGTVGKVINLLRVKVPPAEPQILLKVRFANVDRSASSELGANLLATGAGNTAGVISTGQFQAPQVAVENGRTTFTLADALNIFVFRPDLNLGATIKALENRQLLEILAEPNVLASNGKEASFVAGGEFPFPTLQGGGAGLGAVTIQFREFGVRIHFKPTITPRGSIRLEVMPEVSSLDFSNGLVFQGFNIPALATRRVETEVELEDHQSFVIGGLLDNRLTEAMSRIPGLANIPLLGKMFQSRRLTKSNSELLVLVTPELVRPIPASVPAPDLARPKPFLEGGEHEPPATPGAALTGPVVRPDSHSSLPVEQMRELHKEAPGLAPAATPLVPLVPLSLPPAPNGNRGVGR